MDADYTRFVVKVGGADVAPDLANALDELRIDLSLDVPDRATLRFRDDWQLSVSNSTKFALGAPLEVSLTGEQGNLVKVFSGEITEVEADFGESSAVLVVTGLEKSHRLSHGNQTRTYIQMTDADVVKKIAMANGMQAKVTATGGRHAYLLQSCTDYAYLTERARSAGARWYVENNCVHFVEALRTPGPKLTWGENLRSFRTRASVAEGAPSVAVRGWDPKMQEAVAATEKVADTALLVNSPFAKDATKFGNRINGRQRFRAEATATDQREAKSIAAGLSRRAAAEMASARGECLGDPKLLPGVVLTIDGLGARLDGGYVCTSVTHILSGSQRYVCRFRCGGSDQGSLVDLLGGGHTDRLHPTASWTEHGLVIGIVTNNLDPQNQGRVKVKYPTLPEASESDWARLLSVGAGKGRGMRSIPEPNDEVLVAFEHGDQRRPVVLGGLWSAKNPPPGTNDLSTRKFFTLRSRNGAEMVFEDDTGAQRSLFRVLLAKGAGLFQLGRDATKLESPSPITISGERDITIRALGKLVIDAQEITMKSKTKVAVEGITIEVKGMASVAAEATQVSIKGSAKTSVESSGLTEVKGSMLKLN